MNIDEESDPNHTSDHRSYWLEDSTSLLPSLLDDSWWDQGQDLDQNLQTNSTSSLNSTTTAVATTTTLATLTICNHPPPSDLSKKWEVSDDPIPKTSQNHHHHRKKSHCLRIDKAAEDDDASVEKVRRSVGNNRKTAEGTGNNCNNGNNKEGRWAVQLLNPCATAIVARNLTHVQHLLYVLHELSSPIGDANHRLASHGLRALIDHLSSSSTSSSAASVGPICFSSTEPRLFQRSLIKFYEDGPWFAFPNNIANSSILQILSEEQNRSCNLHVLDIGVSHGVQWPTLLEALSCRSGGPPPLVRLTVIAAAIENDQNTETPFSIGPPDHNFSSRLLGFAKSVKINLQINCLDNLPLQNLNAQIINSSPDKTLIVCAQFRLHHLNHNTPDERTKFFRVLRNLEPKGVILNENNMDCSCNNCGDFATGFSRRVEFLWKFLDSTSAAFKGRESEERRVMEGEAAKTLTNQGEMNEGKEKWCERMREAGFVGVVFGEDAMDGARAMLKKYDSNWEMRAEDRDGCVGLWWKGQPVSFCSLWKLDYESK